MDEEAEQGSRPHGRLPELLGPGGGGADLISTLPEDLLLQVLLRLRCAAAAARTSLHSRRWRGIWTRLPDLTFRDVTPRPLRSALASLGAATAPFLDICVRFPFRKIDHHALFANNGVSSLLHDAARISPVELCFAVRPERNHIQVKVPHFHRATSIELYGLHLGFVDPRYRFPTLERLSLSECRVDLADLTLRCPRLRALKEASSVHYADVIIRSASLQEIDVQSTTWSTHQIVIETPVLKQLALSFSNDFEVRLRVSILAPMLEKVWWRCSYSTITVWLGPWGVKAVRLLPAANNASCVQLPRVHALSLDALAHCAFSFPTEINIEAKSGRNFATQIEKHMVTNFSILELNLERRGHAFGAFVSGLLGMHRICTAIQNLIIILPKSKDKKACPVNCPSDKPSNWRSQTISLTNLEKLEIKGLEGEDYEFDFLKLILRSATMLKSVTVRPSDEVTTSNNWCTKIYDIFKAYPLVQCDIYISLGDWSVPFTCQLLIPDWLGFSMLLVSLFAEEMSIGMLHMLRRCICLTAYI